MPFSRLNTPLHFVVDSIFGDHRSRNLFRFFGDVAPPQNFGLSTPLVEANGAIWAKNLGSNTKRRPNIPELKEDINKVLCRLPLNQHIIGRYLGLHDVSSNDHKERVKKNMW